MEKPTWRPDVRQPDPSLEELEARAREQFSTSEAEIQFIDNAIQKIHHEAEELRIAMEDSDKPEGAKLQKYAKLRNTERLFLNRKKELTSNIEKESQDG